MDIELLRQAIRELKQVVGHCNGYYREFCPHALGHKQGVWKALVWQFGGTSSKPKDLPNWRWLEWRDLSGITLRDGEWHRGWAKRRSDHRHHLDVIDTVVDEAHAAEILDTWPPHTPSPALRRLGQKKRW